jgi:LysM repeat protein
MGKETKIGLAVIGVLITIFGVLLFRQFGGKGGSPEVASTPIQPLSSAGMSKNPAEAAGKDAAGVASKLWDSAVEVAQEVKDEVAAEIPAASSGDPYADSSELQTAADNALQQASGHVDAALDQASEQVNAAIDQAGKQVDAAVDAVSAGRNPFQSRPGAAADAQSAVTAAEDAVNELAAKAKAKNPLRRLSAELPLENTEAAPSDAALEAPAAIEPAMELPAADGVADPYANGPAVVEPATAEPQLAPQEETAPPADMGASQAAHRNPFEVAPKANLTPRDGSFSNQPDVQREVDAATTQPPVVEEHVPLEAPPAETAPVETAPVEAAPVDTLLAEEPPVQSPPIRISQPQAPRASNDDWQPSEDTGRPLATTASPLAAPAAEPLAAQPSEAVPLPVENGQYTVQPGDTLWSISEKVYGTGGYFKALGARNRSILPRSDKLTVGTQVAVPPTSELERDFPSLCPRQRKSALVQPRTTAPAGTARRNGSDVYIVNEGDTLFDIARYELGKASRWAEIYDLNRDVLGEDFDYLRPGTELVMPAKAEAAAKPSGSRYE